MSIFQAFILGLVQGLAEFLPISSSGHLELVQTLFGINQSSSIALEVMLHVGTLIAVFAVYYKLIWRLIKAFFSLIADLVHGRFKWKEMDHDRRLLMMLIIGLLPLFLLFLPVPGTGMQLKDVSELWSKDTTIWIEGLAFLMTSAMLFLGIRAMKKTKPHRHVSRDGKVSEIRGRRKIHTVDAVCIGVTQCAAALFPGLSRSGSTLATGLMRGINQQTALDYSFVLGIPSILAAAVLTISDVAGQPADIGVGVMIAGVVTAAIVGFLAIKLLKWIVTTNKLQIFAYYTLILGVATLIVAAIEAIGGKNLFNGLPL